MTVVSYAGGKKGGEGGVDLREDCNHHNEGEGEIQQHEEYVVLVRRHDLFHDFIHDLLGVVAEAATRSEATRWWFCCVVVLLCCVRIC